MSQIPNQSKGVNREKMSKQEVRTIYFIFYLLFIVRLFIFIKTLKLSKSKLYLIWSFGIDIIITILLFKSKSILFPFHLKIILAV